MKKFTVVVLSAFFTLLSSFANAELAVIVNPANNANMTQNDIAKIFLGKAKSFPDGNSAVPVNLSGAMVDQFNEKVLNKTSTQIKAYWSKLVFTGKGAPPKDVDSEAEMKQLVAANPNIIGYIDASQVDDSVKVILTL